MRAPSFPLPRRPIGAAAGLALLASLALACAPAIDAQLDEAQSLVASGQPREALPLLERAVQRQPESGPANLLLGQVLLQVGDTRTAVPPLQRALESDRYAVPAGLLLASAQLREGRPREAEAAVNKVLATHPDQPAALRIRATARLQIGDHEGALADAQRILVVAPEDTQAPVLIGTALTRLGRLDEAEEILVALEAETREADATARHAAVCAALSSFLAAGRREPARAEKSWRDCVARHAAEPVILNGATAFFDQRGDAETSIALLREAVAADPDALGLRFALAQRLAARGAHDEADGILVEATEAGSASSDAWRVLASFRRQQGDLEGTLAALEPAIDAAAAAGAELEADELRFQRALTLLDLGRLEEAREAGRALSAPALTDMVEGRLQLAEGDGEAALASFERAARRRPGDARAHYLVGVAAQSQGKLDRALEAHAAAIARDPGATDAALDAALLNEALGNHAQAIELARRHRNVRPTAPREATLIEARSLAALGQDAAGVALLERWVAGRPQDYAAYGVLIQLLSRAQGADAALARIASLRAGGLDLTAPAARPVLSAYVLQSLAVGKGETAFAVLQKARAREPESVELAAFDAAIRTAVGDLDGAEASLRGVVEAKPDDAGALSQLGRWLHGRGRNEEALPLLARARELAPADAENAYFEAKALQALGRDDEFEARLRALVAAEPLNASACNDLAWHLADAGRDLDLALELARRAARLQPDGDMLDTLGWVLLVRGEPAEAADALEQAVARSPEHPGFRYRLGLALARTGREAEAREAFEKALAAAPFPEAEQARAELAQLEKR